MARHVIDIFDAIVHEEDLAGPIELANYHVANQAVIEMRERGEIDNVVLRKLQADLDMTASRPGLNPAETD